jgi:AhpD family alkylhydroperoxidase
LRDESELDPKLRELAILAVGHTAGSDYEIAHHQSHAIRAGATQRQIADVADFESSDAFNDAERALMRLARESTLQVHVSGQRWADARAHLSDRQMVELCMTIAWYNSGVRIMGSLGIELEDSYRH